MRHRVYVAGALNSDAVGYIKNMHRMIDCALKLMKKGYAVFIPGIDFLVGLQAGYFEYDDYFDNSWEWLKVSEAVFVVPKSENSQGTKDECNEAMERGIPVFHDIEKLDKYFYAMGG